MCMMYFSEIRVYLFLYNSILCVHTGLDCLCAKSSFVGRVIVASLTITRTSMVAAFTFMRRAIVAN